MDEKANLLLHIFDEARTHARHHLTQQTQVANFVVAASALSLVVAGQMKFSEWSWIPGLFIVVLALYGGFLNRKLTERFQFHDSWSDAIYYEIADKHPDSKLRELLEGQIKIHKARRDYRPSLSDTWKAIYIVLFLIGLGITSLGFL